MKAVGASHSTWLDRCLAKVWSRCLRCGGLQFTDYDAEHVTAFRLWAECEDCGFGETLLRWRTD